MPKKYKSKQKKKFKKKTSIESEDSSFILEKNESSNPKNDNKNIKIIKKDNHNQNTFINTHDLSILEYYEKQITPDGNCYYRCLSYYYRGTEEYHLEFRQLII